jgi:transposase
VSDGPANHALGRAKWTYAELAEHLYQTRGARVGKSALQAFGAKHGVRPYRPTYRSLRGDPAKLTQASEDIADLKKGRRSANSS